MFGNSRHLRAQILDSLLHNRWAAILRQPLRRASPDRPLSCQLQEAYNPIFTLARTLNVGLEMARAEEAAKPQSPIENLEVKDAQVIFTNVWNTLEEEFGTDQLRFSKELILLGGAPGSGKGTNTAFIMKARGLTCEPIVVSTLLTTPEAERIKAAGGMVGDREVVELVFRKLLEEDYRDGCVLDGFPRTQVQVECLKLLVLKMNQLYRQYHRTPLAINFRKPTIHVMVLFVDEKTSIQRQLRRGREVAEWNA